MEQTAPTPTSGTVGVQLDQSCGFGFVVPGYVEREALFLDQVSRFEAHVAARGCVVREGFSGGSIEIEVDVGEDLLMDGLDAVHDLGGE